MRAARFGSFQAVAVFRDELGWEMNSALSDGKVAQMHKVLEPATASTETQGSSRFAQDCNARYAMPSKKKTAAK